jgi:hypothetical protein
VQCAWKHWQRSTQAASAHAADLQLSQSWLWGLLAAQQLLKLEVQVLSVECCACVTICDSILPIQSCPDRACTHNGCCRRRRRLVPPGAEALPLGWRC